MNINKTHKLTIIDKQYQIRRIAKIKSPRGIRTVRKNNHSSVRNDNRKAA